MTSTPAKSTTARMVNTRCMSAFAFTNSTPTSASAAADSATSPR